MKALKQAQVLYDPAMHSVNSSACLVHRLLVDSLPMTSEDHEGNVTDLQYLDAIIILLETTTINEETESSCENSLVNDVLFYQLALVPALLILISYAFTQTRRRLLLNVIRARPGLIYPMDITSKQHRISYACAFGSTVYLIIQCIFYHFQVFEYDGPLSLSSLLLLASVLVFGVVHFPVFACLTVGSAYGYGLGALYTWMLTIVSFMQIFGCDMNVITRVLLSLRNAPYLMCLLYLCVTIPGRFFKAIRKRTFFVHSQEGTLVVNSLDKVRSSNPGLHVRNLLKRPTKETEDNTKSSLLMNFIMEHTYRVHPGFQYSARLLSTLLVAFIILYSISFELFTLFVVFYMRMEKILDRNYEFPILDTTRTVLHYLTGIVLGSLSIATLLGVYGIMRLFIGYRVTMYRMYRGDLNERMREKNFTDFLIGAMKYSGFQVIYVVWGFVIHVIIFLLICSIIAFIFGTISNGYYQWLTDGLLQLWPIYLWTIVIDLGQRLVARFSFLQSPQESIDLTNRRVFFIFTYFTFFYNIFLGLFSCVLRILKAVVIGALIVPRLDQSNLPTLYDQMDPGYIAYIGFMKLECAQTHPVMLVFLRILNISVHERRLEEAKGQLRDCPDDERSRDNREQDHRLKSRKQRAAIFNWHVLYTLINNPDLRMHRKGYLQKVKIAKEQGLTIPKSDTFVDIEQILQDASWTEKDTSILSKAARAAEGKVGALWSSVRLKLKKSREGIGDVLKREEWAKGSDGVNEGGDEGKDNNNITLAPPSSVEEYDEVRGKVAEMQESSNCPQESSNCPQKSSNCPWESLNCPQESSNCPQESSNCQQESSNCQQESSNYQQKSLNCRQESSNSQQKSLNCEQECSTFKHESSKCQHESSECKQESSICKQESSKCQQKCSNCKQESSKCQQKCSNCQYENSNCQQGCSSCQQKSSKCQDGCHESMEPEVAKCPLCVYSHFGIVCWRATLPGSKQLQSLRF